MQYHLMPPFKKILVVGPIYNRLEQLSHVQYITSNYDWIILNGGICFPSDNLTEVQQSIDIVNNLIATTDNVIYCAGRLDLLLLNSLEDGYLTSWIKNCPNIVIADFPTRSVLIMDGGLPTSIKKRNQLSDNLEISFISHIDNKPWHQSYDGKLGYVISNNPLTNTEPRFYNYSMQIGNSSGPLYAQEVGELGLKKTILL
jgi:hypothetical protein